MRGLRARDDPRAAFMEASAGFPVIIPELAASSALTWRHSWMTRLTGKTVPPDPACSSCWPCAAARPSAAGSAATARGRHRAPCRWRQCTPQAKRTWSTATTATAPAATTSRLIARFPFGLYNEQAQLELAYVAVHDRQAGGRDLHHQPLHPHLPDATAHIDYAYYLQGADQFRPQHRPARCVFRTDTSARDLNAPAQSFNDFDEVAAPLPQQPLRRRTPASA